MAKRKATPNKKNASSATKAAPKVTAKRRKAAGAVSKSVTTRSGRKTQPTRVHVAQPARIPRQRRPVISALTQFQLNLYDEIDTAAGWMPNFSGDQTQRLALEDMWELLRDARIASFFNRLTDAQRSTLAHRLQAQQSTGRYGKLLSLAQGLLINDTPFERARIEAFDGAFVVLSICSLSKTFRDTIRRPDSESDNNGLPRWSTIEAWIKPKFHSLELFGRGRSVEILKPLVHYEKQLSLLITGILQKHLIALGVAVPKAKNFGLEDGDLNFRHPGLPANPDLQVWALAAGNAPARRTTVRFAVTQDLVAQGAATSVVGTRVTANHLTISDSIPLMEYKWPNKHQWPENDPRYAGLDVSDICIACSRQGQPLPNHTRNHVVGGTPRVCSCDWDALRDSGGCPQKMLYELFDTGRIGTGVRILQHAEHLDYLGLYVGEIYPVHNGYPKSHKSYELTPSRYGPPEGSMYRLDQEMKRRYLVRSRQNRMRTLARDEIRTYAVDSAIKGNWTRYANHSCNPNMRFVEANLGQRTVTVFEAIRSIEFGEELTISYGRQYFRGNNIACMCGWENCRLWDINALQKGNNEQGQLARQTLGQAKAAGAAPAWAMNDSSIPWQ